MSDSHGTTGNPYGDPQDSGPSGPPPPPPNPYDPAGQPQPGQQPSGQPSPGSTPQSPYGQPPAAPYGQGRTQSFREMYGETAPEVPSDYALHGYGGGQQVADDKRPGTVTAAAIITLVFSGLTAVLFGLALIALMVARQDVTDAIDDELAKQPGMEDIVADDVTTIILVVVAIMLIWTLISCLLAVLVMRRSNVARILLVISSAFSLLGSLISIGSGLSAVSLLASGAVIVLLFVGGANEWFRSKNQPYGLRPA